MTITTRNIVPTAQLPPLQFTEKLRSDDRRMLSGEFGGLRMGLSHGEMLFADENWADIRQAAPSDNSHNTIARAARLMGLDAARWDQSELGQRVQDHLGDWTTDDALIFFDESVYTRLPDAAKSECREIDVVKFKGVGPHRCFGARINKIALHF
jgi:hypothetical protein